MAGVETRQVGGNPIAVGQGRFVAVMPVGDVDRQVPHLGGDQPVTGRVANPPQAVAMLAVIPEIHVRRCSSGRLAQRSQDAVLVGVNRKDRTEIGVAGLHQAQALGFDRGVGALVGQNDALLEGFQPHSRDQAHAGADGAREREFDAGQIKDRGRVLAQDAFGQPAAKGRRCAGVGVVRGRIPRAGFSQDQANNVVGVPFVEGLLLDA